MFELLPGVGVRLPGGAGVLGFGAGPAEVREVLGRLGPVRAAGGGPWAYRVRWGGVEVTARPGGGAGLEAVTLAGRDAPVAPVAPVALGDVDLFGYPAGEVVEALGEGSHPGLRLGNADPARPLPSVTLRAEPPSGAPEVDVEAYAALWTTERDAWRLEDTGSGYLIVRKGDPEMNLVVCHPELAEELVTRMLAAGVEVVTV
ncbi:hypothetical protein ABZ924_34895 [Streptomyces sp. NPDC046876]|uniref:hypothetical protein n=1 Tax=Streptomyces sp. NPDC046876 TaxID=3155616 RepID=UPI0033C0CA2F